MSIFILLTLMVPEGIYMRVLKSVNAGFMPVCYRSYEYKAFLYLKGMGSLGQYLKLTICTD